MRKEHHFAILNLVYRRMTVNRILKVVTENVEDSGRGLLFSLASWKHPANEQDVLTTTSVGCSDSALPLVSEQ